VLVLRDGRSFRGQPLGAVGRDDGEVIFNTAMSGYQEILTDPSYRGQIVTMTYPMIGNYGLNDEDVESRRPWANGFIVKEASPTRRPGAVRIEPRRVSAGATASSACRASTRARSRATCATTARRTASSPPSSRRRAPARARPAPARSSSAATWCRR
jgi:hypothetical protein